MKTNIILILTWIAVLAGCEKEPYPEFNNSSTANDITRIELFANSRELIANDANELTFKYRVFGETTIHETIEGENGNPKDTSYIAEFRFKEDRLPRDIVKIYTENGDPVNGLKFSTSSSFDSMGFYAEGGNARSDLFKVKLISTQLPDFTPITIPVVFHVLATDENRLTCNGYDTRYFQEKIDRLNKIFANELFNAPTGVNLNVKFELATHDPNGKQLKESGVYRMDLGDNDYAANMQFITDHLMWDPNRYLNVWICRWSQWDFDYPAYNYNAYPPKYTTANSDILPGINLTEVNDPSEAIITEPQDIGIIIKPGKISNDQTDFSLKFGEFFGLKKTEFASNFTTPIVDKDVDYCSDTYTYRLFRILIEKNTYQTYEDEPIITFDSHNIMDEYSSSTTISYQQALRIRSVLENCPLRMMRK